MNVLANITKRAISKIGSVLAPRPFSEPAIPVFSGDFRCWQDAASASGGYDQDAIFEKTAKAMLAINSGEGLYERDSVIFHEYDPLFPWPLLSSLLWCASMQKNDLHVVDFGGAIGSTYFQCRPFMSELNNTRWTVVDQPKQVQFGKANLENEVLRFTQSIEGLENTSENTVLILSSVLQYLPDPYATLRKLLDKRFESVIVDRTAFWRGHRDRLTIQNVPSDIYEASYPAWFFNKTDFFNTIEEQFKIKSKWRCGDSYTLDGTPIDYLGALLRRKHRSSPTKT